VVVTLREGVELVIVAARAGQRQAQKGFSGGIYSVGQPFVAELGSVQRGFMIGRSDGVKARTDPRVEMLQLFRRDLVTTSELQVVRPEFVARDLLLDEPVVRLIGLERLNDVVAVPPGIAVVHVRLEAARIGIPHDIQPVPSLGVRGPVLFPP
jgi:hypothetical protein